MVEVMEMSQLDDYLVREDSHSQRGQLPLPMKLEGKQQDAGQISKGLC